MIKFIFEGTIDSNITNFFKIGDDGAVILEKGHYEQKWKYVEDSVSDSIYIFGKQYDLEILFGTTETTIRLREVKGFSSNSTEVNSSPDEAQMSRIEEAADRSMSTPQTQEENTSVEAKLTNSIDRIESVNIDRQQELINLQLEINATLDDQLRSSTILHDGMERAVDQIQDKRITWLESGPEVRASDIMVEMLWTALPLGVGMIGKSILKSLASKRISERVFKNIWNRQKVLKKKLPPGKSVRATQPGQKIDTTSVEWTELNKKIGRTRNAKLRLATANYNKSGTVAAEKAFKEAAEAEAKGWKAVIKKAETAKAAAVKRITEKRKTIMTNPTETKDGDLTKTVKEVLSDNLAGIAVSGIKKKVSAKGSKLKQGNSAIVVLRSQVQKHLREEEYRTRSIVAYVDARVKLGLNNEREMLDVYIELSSLSVSLALPAIKIEEYDYFVDVIHHETEKILWSVLLASKIQKEHYHKSNSLYRPIKVDTQFRGVDDRVILYLISRFADYVPSDWKWTKPDTWFKDDKMVTSEAIKVAKMFLDVKTNFATHCADMLSMLVPPSGDDDETTLNSALDKNVTNIPGIWEEITPLQFRSDYKKDPETPKPESSEPEPESVG